MSQRIAIRARTVWKSLAGRVVLRGVELTIGLGECVVLRGPNGSGKSTLLRCLAGLIEVDGGSVEWFEGRPVAREMVGLRGIRTRFTRSELRENLAIAGQSRGLSDAREQAEQVLHAAGLWAHADRLPREVSQGMRRRAAIARGAASRHAILLLDEPGTGLDEAGRRWLARRRTTVRREGLRALW